MLPIPVLVIKMSLSWLFGVGEFGIGQIGIWVDDIAGYKETYKQELNPTQRPHLPSLILLQISFTMSLPTFDELPVRPNAPKAAAWGVWGDDDELGTLNHLTPESVKAAMGEVVKGETIALK